MGVGYKAWGEGEGEEWWVVDGGLLPLEAVEVMYCVKPLPMFPATLCPHSILASPYPPFT